jgi:multidrug resistance protein MdtO
MYTMLDWPGLLTSIVTVFFVALGSVGETVHKLTLRISGAIIGGLIAGLSIVFILPHFTDIGQLCALTAVVVLFAGWVSTSSERLSYAGMQIALAFFMGLLQTYSHATDLTVLRDRIAASRLPATSMHGQLRHSAIGWIERLARRPKTPHSHRLQKLGRPLNPGQLHKWRFPN